MTPPRLRLAAVSLSLALLVLSCADRSRRNPLDPGAGQPLDLAAPLRALAGDGRVDLRWDFSRFDDLRGVRLYRESGDSALGRRPVPKAPTRGPNSCVCGPGGGTVTRTSTARGVATCPPRTPSSSTRP